MSVKANWGFEAVVETDFPNPFDQPVEELGEAIDLRDSVERLNIQLRELVRKEELCHRWGVTCAVKDRDDTCCSACPISEAGSGSSLGRLCDVGRRQEAVCTELAVARCHPQ